jgi:hypothetical protein
MKVSKKPHEESIPDSSCGFIRVKLNQFAMLVMVNLAYFKERNRKELGMTD